MADSDAEFAAWKNRSRSQLSSYLKSMLQSQAITCKRGDRNGESAFPETFFLFPHVE